MNLATAVGGSAYIGFTGGTGLTNLTDPLESITNWSFTAS
jgi:hypothetical protein